MIEKIKRWIILKLGGFTTPPPSMNDVSLTSYSRPQIYAVGCIKRSIFEDDIPESFYEEIAKEELFKAIKDKVSVKRIQEGETIIYKASLIYCYEEDDND